MEKIEDIMEISNDIPKHNRNNQPNESKTRLYLKVIRDTFIFCLTFFISNFILFSDLENRSFREKFVIIFLFAVIFCYTFLTNQKSKILAFFYTIVVFVLIISIIDTRRFSDLHFLILSGILATSLIFHLVKRLVNEKNNKSKIFTEIDLSNFSFIGTLEKNISEEKFIEKRELNMKRGTFNKFKPILIKKMVNEKSEIVLKYTNKDELSFTLLINPNNEVYINHWKENKTIDIVNMSIFEQLKTFANNG